MKHKYRFFIQDNAHGRVHRKGTSVKTQLDKAGFYTNPGIKVCIVGARSDLLSVGAKEDVDGNLVYKNRDGDFIPCSLIPDDMAAEDYYICEYCQTKITYMGYEFACDPEDSNKFYVHSSRRCKERLADILDRMVSLKTELVTLKSYIWEIMKAFERESVPDVMTCASNLDAFFRRTFPDDVKACEEFFENKAKKPVLEKGF